MRKNCSKDVSRERRIEILFVFGVFLFYFLWSCTQRYNFSADESMRYQIAQFIYEHGSLPRGDDPLIRNEDWGTSYAFNPILSYMASAVLMKGMSLFTTNEWMLLLSARFVNVLLGALMAWVVLKAAKLLFPRRYAWMFTALVVFLPGNVILYSYVNCDALAMCSTAIIFYSWVKAYKEGWNWTTCAVSAIGMGLCFLSYYNAYGFILTTFFFFVGTMLTDQEKAPKERWKEMIQKGLFILVKTSNPSSGEFQDQKIDGKPLYELVGEKVAQWGEEHMGESGYSYVGAVVGATYPEQGEILRKVMPKSFILVPGYGAQGGKGKDLVHFFNEDGLGAIVNSSRGIIAAYKQEAYAKFGAENFGDASRAAVEAMIADIQGALTAAK